MGDRVNTASRVQSVAEPGTVYVDEVTRQATAAAIAYEDAGEHAVKGKAEPLQLWRALRRGRRAWRALSASEGSGGAARRAATPSCGWSRSSSTRASTGARRGWWRSRARRASARRGCAGSSRSTSTAWRTPCSGTPGAASPTARASPTGRWPRWSASAWASPRRRPPRRPRAKLAAGLERWVPDPDEREFLAPRLGALLGIAEPGLGREELFAGWRLFFERLCRADPVVLVFEDLQWADDGLLDFIEHLLDWSAGSSRSSSLALARPELAERRGGLARRPRAARRRSPSSRWATTAMARAARRAGDGLPAEARERIVSQAEGDPPLRHRDRAAPSPTAASSSERDGALALTGELGELDVPASAQLAAGRPAGRAGPRGARRWSRPWRCSAAASRARRRARCADVPEERRRRASLASLVRKQVLASAPTRSRRSAGSTPSRRRCCARSPTTCSPSGSESPATWRSPSTCATPSRTRARTSPR